MRMHARGGLLLLALAQVGLHALERALGVLA